MDEKNPIQGNRDVPPQSGSPEYFAPLTSGKYLADQGKPTPPSPVPAAPKQTPLQAALEGVIPEVEEDPKKILKENVITPGATNESPLETLRTFKNDVAEAVKNQKASVITVAVAEQKRKIERKEIPAVPVSPMPESRRNFFMITLSVILIGGGLFAGAYALYTYKVPPKPVAIVLPGNPIISTNSHKEILLDGKSLGDILYLISQEKIQSATQGSVESIYFTATNSGKKQVVGLPQLLTATHTTLPTALTRTLGTDFMLGLHVIKGGKMFLIIRPTYYEGAFPAMLTWESTMSKDLSALFGKASTTASASFTDKVVQNKDSRIQYDDTGATTLIYSFVDKKNIVIAEDEETLAEVARRLTESAKVVR